MQGGFQAKTRHEIAHAGYLWQMAEFGAENAGLVLAEVKLGYLGRG